MVKWNKILAFLLVFVMLLPLLPVSAVIATEPAEERPATRAVDVSSISVPAYSGGTSSSWMIYDGGLGTALGDTGAESKMRIVTGTSSSQYSTYRDLLKSKGYVNLGSVGWASQQSTNNRHPLWHQGRTGILFPYRFLFHCGLCLLPVGQGYCSRESQECLC